MLVCASLSTIARETAGAARTRSFPRPLIFERDIEMQNFGRTAPREREAVFRPITVIARSVADEAIHSSFARHDGLLRCARNDGRGAFGPEMAVAGDRVNPLLTMHPAIIAG